MANATSDQVTKHGTIRYVRYMVSYLKTSQKNSNDGLPGGQKSFKIGLAV